MSFDIVLRNPGSVFDIVLSEVVYKGANWNLRYVGITLDNQLYVGDISLK